MRKKICIGLLAVLLGTGLGAMIVNHIWKEPKQGVDLGATQMIVKELTVQTLGQVSCSDSVKENLRESGKDIKILDMNDMAPIGAALLAGVGAGIFKDVYEAADKVEKKVYKVIRSSRAHVDIYNNRYQVYIQLYPQIKELYKIGSNLH